MVKKVPLPPKLGTAACADLTASLMAAQDQDLCLDASEVEMIGAACVETLMSAAVLWAKAGRSVTLEQPSINLIDDLRRFGLTPTTLLENVA